MFKNISVERSSLSRMALTWMRMRLITRDMEGIHMKISEYSGSEDMKFCDVNFYRSKQAKQDESNCEPNPPGKRASALKTS